MTSSVPAKKKSGLKGQSIWSIADNLAQQALAFLIFAVLARWLTPHEFGLLAIAHLMVQFARLSLLDAMALPVVRAKVASDADFDWLFTLCTMTGIGLAVLMALASAPLASFFGAPELLPVLLGMSFTLVLLGLVRAHEGRLLREGNFRLLALRSICSVGVGGVVALVLAWRGLGALALVAQQLTTTAVALLVAYAAEWKVWRPRWNWSAQLFREKRVEMGHISGSALLNYATANGDAALVSVLLGPGATGLYNLGKRVLSAAYLVIGASINRVGVSQFVAQQADPQALVRSYARIGSMTLLLLAPIYVLASTLAEPLVVIVFGPQWRDAAPLFAWLSVAYFSQSGFGLGQAMSFATGHAPRVPKLALMQLVIAVGLSLVAWRLDGARGVAMAFALAAVSGMLAMQWRVMRQLAMPVGAIARMLAPAVCGSVAAGAVVALWPHTGVAITGWLPLVAVSASGVVAYAVVAGGVFWVARRR